MEKFILYRSEDGEPEFVEGVLDCGRRFTVDYDDYERVSEEEWTYDPRTDEICRASPDGRPTNTPLRYFLLKISVNGKHLVRFRSKRHHDHRRQNLRVIRKVHTPKTNTRPSRRKEAA